MRPLLLLPEMILFVGGLAALITGSFLPRQRQRLAGIIGIVALVASTTAAAVGIGDEPTTAFDGTYAIDTATAVARVVIGVATLLVVILATEELRGSSRESETYALLLFAATGAQLLAERTTCSSSPWPSSSPASRSTDSSVWLARRTRRRQP